MITKEKFDRFEAVRRSGATNMFDVAVVSQLSDLSKGETIDIMKNYARYKKEFVN
jgi:hypothetical protein